MTVILDVDLSQLVSSGIIPSHTHLDNVKDNITGDSGLEYRWHCFQDHGNMLTMNAQMYLGASLLHLVPYNKL